MSEKTYDLIVIGAGPGGYVAAIRGAQLGLKTALIEKETKLGGTCLRVGCIPSKALLHSTELFHDLKTKGQAHGIQAADTTVDLSTLMKRKDTVVNQLTGGVEMLVNKRGITTFHGQARLSGGGKVVVQSAQETTTLTGAHILVATGSSSIELPCLPLDGKTVVSSDQAIAFDQVPEKLVVVGGGAIGLELGSVWARLGSQVTIVELLPQVAPGSDPDIAKLLQRLLKKQGLNFALGTQVTGITQESGKPQLTAEKKGKPVTFEADKILCAVGRKPNTQNLGAEEVGITLDKRGRIEVDAQFRTHLPGVYAIGDVIQGPMLAHKAEEEGIACVESIVGQAGHVRYDVIPNVIYTEPEVASVGMGETAAQEAGISVKVGKFNLAANGRAIAMGTTDGMVKVVADSTTDRLLGVHIIAHGASELIAAAVAHMEYSGSAEDFGRTIHAHPTLSESMKEAALAVHSMSLHQL